MSGRGRRATCALLSVLGWACQPETRRVLLLDLALSESHAVAAVAAPWLRAGYDVDYRRFYPHPTRLDAAQYRVLVLLGGLAPEAPSDALRPSDLDQMAQWLQDGGVLIVGYTGDGEGSLDRWTLNRWLDALGTGLAIGDSVLRDGASQPRVTPRDNGPVRGGGILPFPAGRNHPLTARPAAVLANAAGAPVMAGMRVGDGLIVVASRHALGSLGTDLHTGAAPLFAEPELARTRTFLVAWHGGPSAPPNGPRSRRHGRVTQPTSRIRRESSLLFHPRRCRRRAL